MDTTRGVNLEVGTSPERKRPRLFSVDGEAGKLLSALINKPRQVVRFADIDRKVYWQKGISR